MQSTGLLIFHRVSFLVSFLVVYDSFLLQSYVYQCKTTVLKLHRPPSTFTGKCLSTWYISLLHFSNISIEKVVKAREDFCTEETEKTEVNKMHCFINGNYWVDKIIYTLSLKKCNFSSWIFPGTQGQGHVTRGHEKSAYRFSKVFQCFISYNRDIVFPKV